LQTDWKLSQQSHIVVARSTDGRNGGALQYTDAHPLASRAASVYIANNATVDQYLVVSQTTLFSKLKAQLQNAVLLRPVLPNDGSLAYWTTGDKSKFRQPQSYVEVVIYCCEYIFYDFVHFFFFFFFFSLCH
jgi:hypothetical protein